MSKRKVLIINDCLGAGDMFRREGWTLVNNFEDADLVQFTGGADINPALYKQAEHKRTYYYQDRDDVEVKAYEQALLMNKPIAGICRGAQLICALNGDSLYQHVDNHAIGGTHAVEDIFTKDKYQVVSLHHQMCRIGSNGIIIGIASPSRATKKEYMKDGFNVTVSDDNVDVEVFYYPKSNSLGFQGHPEMNGPKEATDHYFRYINSYLFNE